LLENGAAHVAIADATGSCDLSRADAELTGDSSRISVVDCDLADRAALIGLLDSLPGDRPLSAAFFLAEGLHGDADDAVARRTVRGAANLDELTCDAGLSMFAVFTSTGPLLGEPVDRRLAVAHAYLDALVRRRIDDGLTSAAVAWGLPTGNAGAGGPVDGVHPALVIAALAPALACDDPPAMVADVDWTARAPEFPVALLRDLPEARGSRQELGPDTSALARDAAAWGARFRAGSESEQAELMTDLVRTHTAAVLGHDAPDTIRADHDFTDLGFSSLTAMELSRRLSTVLRHDVSAAAIYDTPTPAALAAHLRAELAPEGSP
jgi:acyl carrier protein